MRIQITIALTLLLTVLVGCPKELAGAGGSSGNEWRKVDAGPTISKPRVDPKLQERFKREVAEKHVKKMQAALTTPDEQVCKADADCTLTPYHCCPCEHGGKLVAVNRTAVPQIVQRRSAVCPDYVCTQMVSTDSSCAATRAVCREGKCIPDVPADAAKADGVGVETIPDDKAPAGAKQP
jgi:hypothetical protein